MAWTNPTLQETIDRVDQDFAARFFGTSAPLRRGVLKTLARVWGAIVYLLTLFLGWIYRNNFVHLCDPDQVELHGVQIGIFREAAAYAAGYVEITGTPGAVAPQGSIIQNLDGSIQYQTTTEAVIPGAGELQIQLTAMGAGSAYNQPENTILEFQAPIAGIDSGVLVVGSAGIGGGDDIEDLEDLRDRVLYKKQNPPQGGAAADYVAWATSQPNCTAAYILDGYPQANSVQVVCADYDKAQAGEPPIVGEVDLERIRQYIMDPKRKPLGAAPVISSVVPALVQIQAQISPNTAQNRTSATEEIRSLFIRSGTPGRTINNETILATIARASGVEAVSLSSLKQDGIEVDGLAMGYRGVAWLDSIAFYEVI